MRMKAYRHNHNKEMSTPAVAQMAAIMLYNKRFFPYYISNILAGLDEHGKGVLYSYDPVCLFLLLLDHNFLKIPISLVKYLFCKIIVYCLFLKTCLHYLFHQYGTYLKTQNDKITEILNFKTLNFFCNNTGVLLLGEYCSVADPYQLIRIRIQAKKDSVPEN